ncbi:hypothetical protein psal_cds_311 [Pandoravirus salinus]|uniref:TOP2c incomplete domain containing protein n=1 Tax=Pandoravirus salinus TaxID=1349410 RepID=S4VU99_9VIRU|nr:hypothetical protein psal_cds_311 [Pandoravirus salinus]AGO83923.1 hypothetical protein psal_cds_311 [Pandoravirus salinus]
MGGIGTAIVATLFFYIASAWLCSRHGPAATDRTPFAPLSFFARFFCFSHLSDSGRPRSSFYFSPSSVCRACVFFRRERMDAMGSALPTAADSVAGDGANITTKVHRRGVVLISRDGDSARTVVATLRTRADSITMDIAKETLRGPLVPWHAAPVPDWVPLPVRVARDVEASGADRACLAMVVFQARDATVESEADLFVGALPRPLDARVYRAPIALALRTVIGDDDDDDVAWIDMDAEACDLVLDAWLAGPALAPCAGARGEFDADSSTMSTDDEGRAGTEGTLAATTTDDDDERHSAADGGVAVPRRASKPRRRSKAPLAMRHRSRRNSATGALADDDRSGHATDDEDVTTPRRRLKASRRTTRHHPVSGRNGDEADEHDEEDDDDADDGVSAVGPADDGKHGIDDDDDDDVCRDSDGDLHTADDDMGDDDMGDDDMGDDLDEIGGVDGGMGDDDLADDEEGDMDDDPNAE